MHRALLIPEIVTQIIDCNRSYPGYLHTCLLINSLFFHSTTRILWYGCGYGSFTKGHVTPYIRHLVQIARCNAQRGQFYADFIKLLRFGDEIKPEHEDDIVVGGEYGNENLYHKELGRLGLEWTNLEDLAIVESECWNKERGEILMQYLQPKLKKFTLHQSSPVGDGFLEMLGERCPGLKCLALKPSVVKDGDGISKDGLVRFLGKCKLECLDIRAEDHGWEGCWEEGVLEVFLKQSNLRQISVPDIDDDAIKQMASRQKATDGTAFPALKSLCTGLTASGLHSLHRITPHLSTLSLDLRRLLLSTSTSILPSVSIFSQLSDLSIKLDKQAQIYGDELTHLALSCPSLSRLSIAKDQPDTERPWSRDITNSHIEALAQSALSLKELYLLFYIPRNASSRELYPTEVALESLARHCINLERLWLTCDPNWYKLTSRPLNVLFPKVWDLQIAGPELRYDLGYDSEDNLRDMAKDFAARCPKLVEFRFLEPYGEEPFDERIRDVLRARP